MSADHIGEATNMIAPMEAVAWRDIATAPKQEPVLVGHSGFLGWRRLAICNALGEWSYYDRPWLQQDPLDETPTHWMPLPPPPSAHPAPIKPSGDTGELRKRVAKIVDPAGFDDRWDVPGLRHEASLDERVDEALAKADAILDLIQKATTPKAGEGSPIGQNDVMTDAQREAAYYALRSNSRLLLMMQNAKK